MSVIGCYSGVMACSGDSSAHGHGTFSIPGPSFISPHLPDADTKAEGTMIEPQGAMPARTGPWAACFTYTTLRYRQLWPLRGARALQ